LPVKIVKESTTGAEKTKQVIDASSSGTTWPAIHNSDSRQTAPLAGSGKVNKTYTPFIGNTNPTSQGRILWRKLF